MEVAARRATEDDFGFIAGVLTAVSVQENPATDVDSTLAWATGYTREQVQAPEEGSTLYVVESGGSPVGRLRVVRTPERVFLAGIQLRPENQGQGIGTSVITSLLDEGRANGLPVQLDVDRQNAKAQRLYRRLGFEQYGESDRDLRLTCS
jgi:ribosomal protein S18 acetylase RimI-like enzyme